MSPWTPLDFFDAGVGVVAVGVSAVAAFLVAFLAAVAVEAALAQVTSESGQPLPLTRPAAELAGLGVGQWLARDRPTLWGVRLGPAADRRTPGRAADWND